MTPIPRVSSEALIRLQREANESLILAGLRAHEQVDDAQGALRHAEGEVSELRVRAAELRATAEFRERLLGIIGHDLRNPLNTIVMASGLLIGHGKLSDEDARLANRIVSSGQRMTRMIGQLVEFTRARLGGGFDLELQPSDLGKICQDIIEELRVASCVEVRWLGEGDLGGIWDADRLAQVVSNLASNALDYAKPGTPVLLHAFAEGEAVVVEITNQGVCIAPELLPSIFTAFRRAQVQSHGRTGHLGLGLYIAAELVHAHGGTIEVRSADETTTFTLRLPRAPSPVSGLRAFSGTEVVVNDRSPG